MNVPFALVRGLLHTDYMRVRPDFRAVRNPYDASEEIAVVPAISPDVAIFHGFWGDRAGNVVTSGSVDAKLIAQASRIAIATVEELVDGNLAREPHTGVLVPGIHMTAVVHAPRGTHPTGCPGHHGDDVEHIQAYLRAASGDESFRRYVEQFIVGTRDHAEYLARVDEARMPSAARS